MPPRNALRRRIGRVGAAVRAGLFVVLAMVALSLAVPTSAYADFSCNFTGDDSYQMDTPGTNGESIMPAVNQWQKGNGAESLSDNAGMITGAVKMPLDADKYTLYELDGMRGMNWSMTFKGRGDASEDDGNWGSGADSCAVMAYVNNGIADTIFNGTKILTRTAISIKESASNPSPLAGLYSGRDDVVDTLRKNVLVPAVPVMILLVGLWVFTKWRSGDMREVWAGISWAALTVIAVTAFLTGNNYHKVVETADSGIAKANSALTATVLAGASGEMQSPCDLPDGSYNEGLRLSSCAMYDTLAFRPWSLGQFGDPGKNCIFKNDGGKVKPDGSCAPNNAGETCSWGKGARCEDLRVRQAVAQSWTNKDEFAGKDIDKYKKQWMPIRQDISGGKDAGDDVPDKNIYPVAFNDWAGKNAGSRVGIAFYSIVAAFIVGLMVIVLSALTLLWHAVTLILVIMLPLIATLGIHPSQQKLLKGWLETFVHSFVLRAGFGVILTVLLVLYQMILPANIALGTQLLMLLLVTVAVVMMLKKLLAGNFSPQFAGGGGDALGIRDAATAGSEKSVDRTPDAVKGAGRSVGRTAGRAAAGATRYADKKWLGDRLKRGGVLAPSKRDQAKSAYRSSQVTDRSYEGRPENGPHPQEPVDPQPPKPRRRVSGTTGSPAGQAPQAPVPQPGPQPGPQGQGQGRGQAQPHPRSQPRGPRQPTAPQQAPPAPRPDEPRPDGRVSK
ncbi:hypothetical protein [Streptomyces sp. NPDC058272]|uniref:hypothetical protein n=1 Tax=Streptomyces sp. NPDC058272 TaxID=3346415 RepID=UPI0036DFE3CA